VVKSMSSRLIEFISKLASKYEISDEDYNCLVKLVKKEIEETYRRGRKEEREYLEALMGRIPY